MSNYSNSFEESIQEMLDTVILSLMPVPLIDHGTQPVPVSVPCVTSTSFGNGAGDTRMNPMTMTMPKSSSSSMLEQEVQSQRCERLSMYPRAAAWKATKAICAQTQSQSNTTSNASSTATATSDRQLKRVSRNKNKIEIAEGQGSKAKKANNWKCGICPLTFLSLSKLNNHRCKYHLKEVLGLYGCPNCDHLFREGSKLLEHYNDHL